MPTLTIDGREVVVPEGATVLDACRQNGIDIPTMCFLEGLKPYTSCMLCVVKQVGVDRLIPSCSARVSNGMIVVTDDEEIRDARRTALELLLSDHVGDCEGPCRRACPAHMNIPLMIRQILAGRMDQAIATVKDHIALPAVLGRLCPAPCEKACRRGAADAPVAICLLKRLAADVDLARPAPYAPVCRPPSGRRVAVVGAGPAGLSAAFYLLREGYACTVFEARERPGGALRHEELADRLPQAVLDAEIDVIRRMGLEWRMSTQVGRDVPMRAVKAEFDAVVVAVGHEGVSDACGLDVGVSDGRMGVDLHTLATAAPGLFAGGAAVRRSRLAVRAVADGRLMAASVDRFLRTGSAGAGGHEFDCRMGHLLDGELDEFMRAADGRARVQPLEGDGGGFSEAEAVQESGRCLHCDCRAASDCRLRTLARRYEARQSRYAGEHRRTFESIRQHADVVYEPGKCIRCGLCVRLTERAKEALGLTFIGRGFDVRVAVPFDQPLALGLEKAARECVEACPTGALAWRL